MCLTDPPVSKQSVMGRGGSEVSEKKKGKVKICGHLVHENPHQILSSKSVEELTSLSLHKQSWVQLIVNFAFQAFRT